MKPRTPKQLFSRRYIAKLDARKNPEPIDEDLLQYVYLYRQLNGLEKVLTWN